MEIKFRANDQLALDYLRHLFNSPAPGPIRLSLASDFGRMAVGLFKTSDTPIEHTDDVFTVTLVLPRHQATAAAMTRYAYFSEADTKRLNAIIDALFNIDLDTYYLQGIQAGMPKRDVIEGFVLSRRLVSVDYADTLGKRVYRSSLSALRRKVDIIHRKARYHYSQIQPPELLKK